MPTSTGVLATIVLRANVTGDVPQETLDEIHQLVVTTYNTDENDVTVGAEYIVEGELELTLQGANQAEAIEDLKNALAEELGKDLN